MALKPFSERIIPDRLFDVQRGQFSEKLIMQGSVPAASTGQGVVNVSNYGDFYCTHITGQFSTLASPAGAIVDTGLNYLTGQLIDGAGQRKLFNERIPLSLFMSPGRRRDSTSTTVLTDPVGNSLFFPIEFEYLFTKNSNIYLDLYNSSDETNYYEICFHGIRIVSNSQPGIANYQPPQKRNAILQQRRTR